MEGTRLILNDGTVIEGARAGYAGGALWCYLPGYTMQQAAGIFFVDLRLEVIRFQYGDFEDVYDGYTHVAVMQEADEIVSVCLTRGAV